MYDEIYSTIDNFRLQVFGARFKRQVTESRVDLDSFDSGSSLIQASRAFHAGQVASESLPHSVVAHLAPFFRAFDLMMQQLISRRQLFDDDNFEKVRVTLDNKVGFTYHLATVSRSISRQIGVLMRLRKLIPTKAKATHLQISCSAVFPILQPGVVLLSSQRQMQA